MNIRFLSFLENFDKLFDTDNLDEFRDLIGSSLKRQEQALKKDLESLKLMEDVNDENAAGYESHIEDRRILLQDVDNLAGQLLIVALYRQTELHIKRVVKRAHPAVDTSKLFNFKALKSAIPFNIEALPKFASFNELRMLNNAVKHQGKVTDELSHDFPIWELGEDLTGLDSAYERLKPEIAELISGFVAGCYQTKKRP